MLVAKQSTRKAIGNHTGIHRSWEHMPCGAELNSMNKIAIFEPLFFCRAWYAQGLTFSPYLLLHTPSASILACPFRKEVDEILT